MILPVYIIPSFTYSLLQFPSSVSLTVLIVTVHIARYLLHSYWWIQETGGGHSLRRRSRALPWGVPARTVRQAANRKTSVKRVAARISTGSTDVQSWKPGRCAEVISAVFIHQRISSTLEFTGWGEHTSHARYAFFGFYQWNSRIISDRFTPCLPIRPAYKSTIISMPEKAWYNILFLALMGDIQI